MTAHQSSDGRFAFESSERAIVAIGTNPRVSDLLRGANEYLVAQYCSQEPFHFVTVVGLGQKMRVLPRFAQ